MIILWKKQMQTERWSYDVDYHIGEKKDRANITRVIKPPKKFQIVEENSRFWIRSTRDRHSHFFIVNFMFAPFC